MLTDAEIRRWFERLDRLSTQSLILLAVGVLAVGFGIGLLVAGLLP